MEFDRKVFTFMSLCALKHGGQWDVLAHEFKNKSHTFESLITKHLMLISVHFHKPFVTENSHWNTMFKLFKNLQLFKNLIYARYSTDVRLQKSFRPRGSI